MRMLNDYNGNRSEKIVINESGCGFLSNNTKIKTETEMTTLLLENITSFKVQDYLGRRTTEFHTGACLTVIYITIFATGLLGNFFTCVVILRNFYMRTITNYYLASLAISDLLALTFGKISSLTTIHSDYSDGCRRFYFQLVIIHQIHLN